jgi:hypothetical protein
MTNHWIPEEWVQFLVGSALTRNTPLWQDNAYEYDVGDESTEEWLAILNHRGNYDD